MVRCPRCKKEVSELDEKCKYCGLIFDDYKPQEIEKDSEESNYSYVTGYNIFLWILGIFIFVGGIIIGQEEFSLILSCWICGTIFLVILNLLKNIVQELRILNSKIK